MATKVKRGEKGNSDKEPKLHQVTEWRKKPWENPGSVYVAAAILLELEWC